MMSTDHTEKTKEPPVTERCVGSSPNISSDENKELGIPSSDAIILESQLPPPPPHHVFTRLRKLQMVYIVSFAAIFSSLSANVYFPSIAAISRVSASATMPSKRFAHYIG